MRDRRSTGPAWQPREEYSTLVNKWISVVLLYIFPFLIHSVHSDNANM